MPSLADITIRTTLQVGDLAYVHQAHVDYYWPNYGYGLEFEYYVMQTLTEFYEEYRPESSRVWIAEYQNRRVGFLLCLNRGATAQLRYFIVDEACRGLGLGRKMMHLLVTYAHEMAFKAVYLWTADEHHAAIHLYQQFGFVLVEEKTTRTFGREAKEQRMVLDL